MRINRGVKLVGSLIATVALLFIAGPRVEIDDTIYPIALPANLERYLSDQEGRFDDITPGTEKKIIWIADPGNRTAYAVVYIHGFSASRQETAPLAEEVACRLQANLYYTRLAGHGRTGKAMLEGSVNAWLNDTVEAFEIGKRLGHKVVMIGVSTGGTTVAWLAAQHADEALHACILISPNFGPADQSARVLLWPWGRQMAELFIGRERQWEAENPEHERYWTTRYPTAALLPMMGVVQLATELDLSSIKAPVLIIYSPDDQVVSPQATVKVFSAIGSNRKQLEEFRTSQDPSQHVLAGDILSPQTTMATAEIIHRFVKTDKRPGES